MATVNPVAVGFFRFDSFELKSSCYSVSPNDAKVICTDVFIESGTYLQTVGFCELKADYDQLIPDPTQLNVE